MRTRTLLSGACATLVVAAAVLVGGGGASAGAPTDYTLSCIDDDPNGYGADDRDIRTVELDFGQTITIAVTGCDYYYSDGDITPLDQGTVLLSGGSVVFTVTGGANLNIYRPGAYGFQWMFLEGPAPTTTTAAVTTTAPSTTTEAPTTTVDVPGVTGGVDDVAVVGDEITVTGDNWAPKSKISVDLHSDPVRLGTATADRDGSFSATFALPDDVAPGTHRVVLDGTDAAGAPARVSLEIEIQAVPVATAAPTTVAAPTLPATGRSSANTAFVAVLVLMGGAMLVSMARRPERQG